MDICINKITVLNLDRDKFLVLLITNNNNNMPNPSIILTIIHNIIHDHVKLSSLSPPSEFLQFSIM